MSAAAEFHAGHGYLTESVTIPGTDKTGSHALPPMTFPPNTRLAIVNAAPDLARVEAGRLDLAPEPIALPETLRATLAPVAAAAAKRRTAASRPRRRRGAWMATDRRPEAPDAPSPPGRA
ncbi:hypothetical protein JMJ56_20760 [Belnapia sp. T18]|uniref:Uncharacterized protein n=1 Tax=Belnapia arida TaxID=2804533 RepID=A0ABS1U710_9PROT|nr:hypothetical protein [Belnapia arida]MBL6080453.1 hypothetical protein [Belnapia arida]